MVNSAELIKLNDLKSFWEDSRRATVRWMRGDAVCVMDHAGVAGEGAPRGLVCYQVPYWQLCLKGSVSDLD